MRPLARHRNLVLPLAFKAQKFLVVRAGAAHILGVQQAHQFFFVTLELCLLGFEREVRRQAPKYNFVTAALVIPLQQGIQGAAQPSERHHTLAPFLDKPEKALDTGDSRLSRVLNAHHPMIDR